MPILMQRVILTGFLLLASGVSQAEEKKLIFKPPGSFLGSTGVSQLAYLSGFLDALYYFENKGPLDSVVTNCLFDDESANKILSVHVITARNAVREAKKRGDKDFSVVDALVVKLKQICPKN